VPNICHSDGVTTRYLINVELFLELGSAKGCKGFRETKICNDGPKFVCTTVNERSVLIMTFLSVIL
jgi:hypothetical protein